MSEKKPNGAWRDHAITAADLRHKVFPPVNYIVPGLIPEGLTLLGGRPKVGKSWMALDLANGVADDMPVLGEKIEPLAGDVLYCALEDTQSRLQRRMHKITRAARWPRRLTLVTRWRKLDDGGIDDIADWAASVETPRLVILDTLAGVRPERNRTDTTYDGDYKALLQAHQLANGGGYAILILTHTRKMEADDPLDTISGTLGQVGCADTGLVLVKGKQGASLYVRGRDIEEAEHAVTFNRETCQWSILGDAYEVHQSDTRKKIMTVLSKAGGPLGPKAIAVASGLTENVVSKRLSGMLEAGDAVLVSRGLYAHASI